MKVKTTGDAIYVDKYKDLTAIPSDCSCSTIDYSMIEPEKAKLLFTIDSLKLENLNLKHQVEYYEKYIDFLNNKYEFKLKEKRD